VSAISVTRTSVSMAARDGLSPSGRRSRSGRRRAWRNSGGGDCRRRSVDDRRLRHSDPGRFGGMQASTDWNYETAWNCHETAGSLLHQDDSTRRTMKNLGAPSVSFVRPKADVGCSQKTLLGLCRVVVRHSEQITRIAPRRSSLHAPGHETLGTPWREKPTEGVPKVTWVLGAIASGRHSVRFAQSFAQFASNKISNCPRRRDRCCREERSGSYRPLPGRFVVRAMDAGPCQRPRRSERP